MANKQYVDLINQILNLETNNKRFSTSGELLAYQRGYLTGLIASLIDCDFYAKQQVLKRLKELQGHR